MTLLAALILIMMFNYYVTFFFLAMTKTKGQGECPICPISVSKHLRLSHNLKNAKERAILNNLATGRIPVGGGQCPVVLCNANVLHLEKHSHSHSLILLCGSVFSCYFSLSLSLSLSLNRSSNDSSSSRQGLRGLPPGGQCLRSGGWEKEGQEKTRYRGVNRIE